ncbi:hypothetical protein D9M69_519930 [compost metagenome]
MEEDQVCIGDLLLLSLDDCGECVRGERMFLFAGEVQVGSIRSITTEITMAKSSLPPHGVQVAYHNAMAGFFKSGHGGVFQGSTEGLGFRMSEYDQYVHCELPCAACENVPIWNQICLDGSCT